MKRLLQHFINHSGNFVLGDDQDLDDRVIKKLWEENQELRDQVNMLRSGQPQAEEGQWLSHFSTSSSSFISQSCRSS